MGLDWLLHGSKPKTGFEKQFHRINDKLNALKSDEKLPDDKKKQLRSDLELALKSVSISPFEVIGAPRVGIDEDATEWFKREVFAPIQLRLAKGKNAPRFVHYWGRPFDEVVQDERGKFVVQLAKDQDGVAAISGILCSSLDFRGKAVALSEVITEALKSEAYDDHSGDECIDYADRLEAELVDFKVRHSDWANRARIKEDAEDIEAAVKWLRYWGSRGFGYTAWY